MLFSSKRITTHKLKCSNLKIPSVVPCLPLLLLQVTRKLQFHYVEILPVGHTTLLIPFLSRLSWTYKPLLHQFEVHAAIRDKEPCPSSRLDRPLSDISTTNPDFQGPIQTFPSFSTFAVIFWL